jgi:hypothetical protein
MILPSAGNIKTTCKSFHTLSGVSLGYSIELRSLLQYARVGHGEVLGMMLKWLMLSRIPHKKRWYHNQMFFVQGCTASIW